jgi:RimJ/RimL family protein N-acetyltransferase
MTHPPLETDRLLLRHIADTDEDAARVFELDSDPEVMRYIGPRPVLTAEAYRERIRTTWLPQCTSATRGVFAVFEREGGAFVGWVFVRPAPLHRFATEIGWSDPAEMELGYRYRRAAWGRGYATEAARPLVAAALADPHVSAVVATALVTNRGSWRVMQKLGMRHVRDVNLAGYADPLVIYAISSRPA